MPPDRSFRPVLMLAACLPALAAAQSAPAPTLEHCAAIGAPTDRLTCYDKLAGRAPAVTEATTAPLPDARTASPSSPSLLAPVGTPVTARPESGFLSRYWELDPSDKRGIFNFVGYQPNYVLPLHYTNHINRSPQSPTQAAVEQPAYKREEAKFQLSLRTKLVQDAPLIGGDLWVAFTQQVLWQIYNGADSKPFRNTDYQPEAIYMLATPARWQDLPLGWKWRYTQFGIAHQSNGQSDPLSRSWNRVYAGAGFERGNWSFTARYNQRLSESIETDNNPDLQTYRGKSEFRLAWAGGLHTASLLYRTTKIPDRYGAVQVEWTYPIFRDQPNGLRWFVQGFSGFGETLTDYNFRQTSLGAGVTFLQF